MKYEGILPIGSDHAGYDLKESLKAYIRENYGNDIMDVGCYSSDSVDYPDYGHAVASAVAQDSEKRLGILICGSGNGINMTANKHQEIRSALCWTEEIASLARQHNNANIIALPARFISEAEAKKIVDVFLTTEFEGGRHKTRTDKISC